MTRESLRFQLSTETDTYEFHILFADYTSRTDHKTRIYISGQPEPTLPMPESFEDEPENNKLWRKYNRAEVDAMRLVLDPGMELIADQLASVPERINFSRKAGCSCGCSSGFVADRPLHNKLGQRFDSIYITKKAPVERTFTMADFDLMKENA